MGADDIIEDILGISPRCLTQFHESERRMASCLAQRTMPPDDARRAGYLSRLTTRFRLFLIRFR